MYEELKRRGVEEKLLAPKVAYGWFRAFAEGDTLVVEHDGRSWPFPFPRQKDPPHLCIADYFRTREEGGDVAGFFVATIGERIGPGDAGALHVRPVPRLPDAARLRRRGHRRAGGVLARGDAPRTGDRRGPPAAISGYVVQEYQGSRYGFGYPSCPDLAAHAAGVRAARPGTDRRDADRVDGDGAGADHLGHRRPPSPGEVFRGVEGGAP